MSLSSLMVHDVTVVHAATITDRYGNLTKDWTNPTRTTVRGWVARRSETEVVDGREAEVSDWVVFLPTGTVITGGDRVEWNGNVFEVNGPPNEAWTPRGPHHIEAQLSAVTG